MEPDEIYKITDETLYRAKKEGRNRVEVTSS
jgi:PleD family two-component response regulator